MNNKVLHILLGLLLLSCNKPSEDVVTPVPPSVKDKCIEVQMPNGVGEMDFTFSESSRLVINGERSKIVEADGGNAQFTFSDKVKAPYSAVYPMGVYSSMDNITIPAR